MTFTQKDLDECIRLANEGGHGWHWWSFGSGYAEMVFHEAEIKAGYHSGPCDDDIKNTLETESKGDYIQFQLNKLDPQIVMEELKEYGLDDENLKSWKATTIWLAFGDIQDSEEFLHV